VPIPIPIAEQARLDSLRTLGGPGEIQDGQFNLITRLAARVLEVPIAYVSLIDETQQYIRAGQGWCESGTMPRRDSFCAHTVAADAPMIIEDTWNDSRFAHSSLVRNEPHARFYAGFPLHGPGGHAVGSLCVLDRVPRQLSKRQLTIMEDFVEQANRVLNTTGLLESQNRLLNLQQDYLRTQEQLSHELSEASRYVESLLPPPATNAVFQADWIFDPCSELGGDAFFYRHVGNEIRMGIFDVSGHGVGAALLSVSLLNLVRNRAISLADRPLQTRVRDIMREMAVTFPMEQNQDMYFTVWLGVFDIPSRRLTFSAAGHPPAFAVSDAAGWREGKELGMQQFPVGFDAEYNYQTTSVILPPDTTLFLFSDGAYEIEDDQGEELELAWFYDRLRKVDARDESLDKLMDSLRRKTGRVTFEDDITLLRLRF